MMAHNIFRPFKPKAKVCGVTSQGSEEGEPTELKQLEPKKV